MMPFDLSTGNMGAAVSFPYLDRVFVGSVKVCTSSAPLDVQWIEGHHSIVCDGLVAVPQKKFCCPSLRIEYKLMPK